MITKRALINLLCDKVWETMKEINSKELTTPNYYFLKGYAKALMDLEKIVEKGQ